MSFHDLHNGHPRLQRMWKALDIANPSRAKNHIESLEVRVRIGWENYYIFGYGGDLPNENH